MDVDPLAADISARTDSYFNRTKQIVARFGDKRVTYALFLSVLLWRPTGLFGRPAR